LTETQPPLISAPDVVATGAPLTSREEKLPGPVNVSVCDVELSSPSVTHTRDGD
jgi:hypothetical protein